MQRNITGRDLAQISRIHAAYNLRADNDRLDLTAAITFWPGRQVNIVGIISTFHSPQDESKDVNPPLSKLGQTAVVGPNHGKGNGRLIYCRTLPVK
jgi:hypothetical protein